MQINASRHDYVLGISVLHTINGLSVARGDRHAYIKISSLVIPLASKVFWVCNMEVGGVGGLEEWGGERKGRGGGVRVLTY